MMRAPADRMMRAGKDYLSRRTADDLAAEGQRLAARGVIVVVALPSQEWMFVDGQIPFVRAVMDISKG